MKAYIQTDTSGDFYNVNAFVAHDSFKTLGWETVKFCSIDEITEVDPEHLIVGGIANVRKQLERLGINRPEHEIDYPPELEKYLGRKVWASSIEEILDNPQNWNVFVKPKDETKKFVGKVVRDYKDFIGLIDKDNPTQIWCSELVDFKTEWRCFIRYGEILDIRRYKGAWDTTLDVSFVKNAILDFKSAPAAYGLDVGIDQNNQMKLVEVNDGHSLGTYGIGGVNYAKFLSARWAQLTGTKDYADF